ncbi:hypothetical protein D3C78_1915650 [compost metagenome]
MLLIEKTGRLSSFIIVPVPILAALFIVAFNGDCNVTVSVSSSSNLVSVLIITEIVLVVSVGANVSFCTGTFM